MVARSAWGCGGLPDKQKSTLLQTFLVASRNPHADRADHVYLFSKREPLLSKKEFPKDFRNFQNKCIITEKRKSVKD